MKLTVQVEIDKGVFSDPLVEAEDAAIWIKLALQNHSMFRGAHIAVRSPVFERKAIDEAVAIVEITRRR